MNQTTKKQHYIWRYYLTPWTSDNTKQGKIVCLHINNGKIFSTSLMNVANENYFYRCERLSELDKKIIYDLAIKWAKGDQRAIHQEWLDAYCALFDYVDDLVSVVPPELRFAKRAEIESSQKFKNTSIEWMEKLHSQIEHNGQVYIASLRENDLSFWEDETERDKFSFFVAVQYFRTKKIRDGLSGVLKEASVGLRRFSINWDKFPDTIWIPLSFMLASDIEGSLGQGYSAVLLQTDSKQFIVGDQPVINTHATFDMQTPPKALELLYPITPQSALLLTTDPQYISGQLVKITDADVAVYNNLIYRVAYEQVYAKSKMQLEDFIK